MHVLNTKTAKKLNFSVFGVIIADFEGLAHCEASDCQVETKKGDDCLKKSGRKHTFGRKRTLSMFFDPVDYEHVFMPK